MSQASRSVVFMTLNRVCLIYFSMTRTIADWNIPLRALVESLKDQCY